MIWTLVTKVILPIALASGYNYCNNKTHSCVQNGMEHFMCRLNKFAPFGGSTQFHAMVPDTPELREDILSILNNFRDSFAAGELMTSENKTFSKAKRMRCLIWDNELGYMARRHASTLSFKHSDCRSTQRFPYVGECLAMITPKHKLKIHEILVKMFREMFNEHQNVLDPEGLLSGFDSNRDDDCAHFAIIVSDRVSRVGCGIAVGSNCRYGSSTTYCHFLTCHFDFNNLNGSYVYKAGDPSSGCGDWDTTGSTEYSNLCQNNGQIFPPDHGSNKKIKDDAEDQDDGQE
ncbi:venom allergen 3-like [Drosophila ficusphila]|uniref:venom allergen 3-like n=1 Tax=Drosophila ficusphila TaxID=30025 RepID=UPI0007E8A215|nr:venom allergen 3-like [Drosophila ficusphila]